MLFEKFKQVRGIVLDVDGVLTNGSVLLTETGEQLRQFNIKDGYALQLAVKQNYQVSIITGGRSEGLRIRMNSLGIDQVFMGVSNKLTVLINWCKQKELQVSQILYIGDDIPDLKAMKEAGMAACPADAAEEVKAVADYISPRNGGEGMVRDVVEKVLKLQGKWNEDTSVKSV